MNVSVCIAVYNGSSFLPNTLPTILHQINKEDEIIIIDDASDDNSVEIIKSFQNDNIKLYQNEINIGVNHSFLKALKYATKDIILIADQDDYWKPNKIIKVKKIFEKNSIELIVHNGEILRNGSKLKQTIFEANKSGRGFFKNFRSNTYIGCCMAFRKDIRHKLLPKKVISNTYYDFYMGLSAELNKVNSIFVEDCLIEYNRHSNTLTSLYKKRPLYKILDERIRLLWMLIINLKIPM